MVFDWIILRIPGWSRKVRKLRKEWDRAREKALTKDNPLKRLILQKLDDVETQLKMIEEQRMGRRDRGRFAKKIELALAEVNVLLKSKSDEIITTPTGYGKKYKK